MAWKNIGPSTMMFPSGKNAKAGDTFKTKDAVGLNLRALEMGKAIAWVGSVKGKKYG